MMVWYLGSELFTVGAPCMAQGLGGQLGIRVGDCVLLLSLPQPPHGWSGSLMLAPFPDGQSEGPPPLPTIRCCSCSIDTGIQNQQDLSSKHGPVPLSL